MMPNCRVRLYIVVGRKIIKSDEECGAETVRDVLEHLRRRLGDDFERDVYDGVLKDGYALVLNKTPLTAEQLDTPIDDGDTLFLFTALAGG